MFKYYKRNIQNIFFIIILIILFSCQKKVSENISNIPLKNIINIKINGIKLLDTDYEIINYSENEIIFNFNIYMTETNLEIKIINKDKIIKLKKLINPIIELEINNKKHFVKGFFIGEKDIPLIFLYNIDENGKILFSKDNIIKIWGYEDIK